jgi:glucose-1-phosphate thymidylyltransferase
MTPKNEGKVEKGATLQGRVSIGPGTVIKSGSVVRGPAIIGEKTVIEANVYVGPYTSIGNNVVVRRGEIENSIIMDYCVIDVGDRITDSLIGPYSKICSSVNRPYGRRFIVGERSQMTL